MLINDNWKIKAYDPGEERDLLIARPDYSDHYWLSAKVPGDVHSALKDKQLIDEPFFGHNDMKCKWVEKKVWWYRTIFDFDKNDIAEGDHLELTFEGLDTFATVFVNGLEIGSTENMFIAHTFDVTRILKQGPNVIAVKFAPVAARLKEKEKNYWAGFGKDRIWARKAQYHFGWDWGPQILTTGIWRDVHLRHIKAAKIERVYAKTLAATQERATVRVDIDTRIYQKNKHLNIELVLTDGEHQLKQAGKLLSSRGSYVFYIDNPNLWWTHDLGDPHLYQLKVSLFQKDELIDQSVSRIGIRTIEVKQKDESGDPRFTFVLNGVEVFAKGANWIPVDSFVGATPDERYRKHLRLAKEANMNMIRVWGGGIYEKDVFYEECDRNGILVWQDFMFACALYPDYNRDYMANVREEVSGVIQRLANHPSLALWCGNNENDWLYEVEYSAGNITTPFYGEAIYHELIPELLAELDPSRTYWPSSPFGGNDHNSEDAGDRHNWQVWHGNREPRQFGENKGQDYSVEGVSFKNYKKDKTLFSSEFGMHASANRYTLEKNLPEKSFYWGSDEMSYRNKDFHHQKGILLMEGFTGIPQNIEEYMNYSMLTQAEGLKYGIEHYRRNKPVTSGALVWQLNDCWPGTSWSMIDYYLLPKASYYYAKNFFDPVLLSVNHEAGSDAEIWIVNDTLEPIKEKIEIKTISFSGDIVFEKTVEGAVEANSAKKIAVFTEDELLGGRAPEETVLQLTGAGKKNTHYFRDHKDLRLPAADITVGIDQKKQTITVSTDLLARFIKLELPEAETLFDDNFFDLIPGESKTISVIQLDGKPVDLDQLKVTCIND